VESIDITAQYGERVRTQHIARVILLSTIVFVLTGCKAFSPVGDFISQRYTNTASYFNTYYNAQKMFSDAENEVLAGIEAGREKNAKGQTVAVTVSSTARQKFTASIEKNSKLLSYYPTSKFVDDALLMIGKAYYYLDEDQKAQRKFLELIAQFPDSKLIPETKLWYGKSLLRQKQTADGIQQLSMLYTQAINDGDDDIAGNAALALGTYYYEQADYQNALKYYTSSLEVLGDGVENARTQFQIGMCYSSMGDYRAAEDAFRRVGNFKPDYSTTFRASLYESRMLTKQKKFEPALDLLYAKLDDAKYRDYASTAHREIGNTYAAENNITEAVVQYRYVDTAYAHSDDAARSMFALATLYDRVLMQFDSARVYYDKARVEFTASEITPAAAAKSESFGKYFSLRRDLANYDTLIRDISTPGWRKIDPRIKMREDSIHRADSAAVALKGEKLRGRLQLRNPRDTSAAKNPAPEAPLQTIAPGDTGSTRLRLSREAAQLTPEERDSIRLADSTALAMKQLAERQKVDSLSRQVIKTKFELGGLLYLELNRPDSALVYFSQVVHETTDSLLAARTYYTMADLYATADSTSRQTVDSLYRKTIEIAPNSSYAQEARKNLGLAVKEVAADSSEAVYQNAEGLVLDGRAVDAIPMLQSVAAGYPKSPYAPKALYTIGWIYENSIVDNDSAEAAYQRLVKSYPVSPYATAVQPKLAEAAAAHREAEQKAKLEKAEAERKAKEEQAAKEKAEAEKRKALEKPNAGAAADTSAGAQQPALPKAASPADTLQKAVPQDTSNQGTPRDSSSVQPKKDTTAPAPADTTRRGRPRSRE
jgi:cellulose synthase operon protein C